MRAATIWDFVIDALFAVYLVNLLAAIAGTTNAFNILLYGIFGKTVEDKLQGLDPNAYPWVQSLRDTLNDSATMLKDVASAQGTVYVTAQYVVTFVLFIGAVLGIVVFAMSALREARSGVGGATPVVPA
jgi:hypothetical protein